jgi:hypothetical protein
MADQVLISPVLTAGAFRRIRMIAARRMVPFLGALFGLMVMCRVVPGDDGYGSGSRKLTDGPEFAEEAAMTATAWSSQGFASVESRKPPADGLVTDEFVSGERWTGPAGVDQSGASAVRYLVELTTAGEATVPWLGMRAAAGADAELVTAVQPVWFGELQQLERRVGIAYLTDRVESEEAVIPVSAEQVVEFSSGVSPGRFPDPFRRLSELTLAEAVPEDPARSVETRGDLYRRSLVDGVEGWFGPQIDGSRMAVAMHRRAMRNLYPFSHQPLYFEQANLERCGTSYGCLTSAASCVHFTASAAMLPWQIAVSPPCSKVRSLGDCATGCEYRRSDLWPECSLKGAAAEAAVITALIFIFP